MKSIVSVSAWRDLSYLIDIYEKADSDHELIVLAQSRSLFNFIKGLEFSGTRIILFEVFRVPLVFRLVLDFFRLRFLLYRISSEVDRFYFFTNYFDYVSFFLLSKLPDRVEKMFVDHYGFERRKAEGLPAIQKLKLVAYGILSNSRLGLSKGGFIPTFDLPESVNIIEPSTVPDSTLLKYKRLPGTESRVLLVAGGGDDDDIALNQLLHQIRSHDFGIDLKPHPRRSPFPLRYADDSKVNILNADIPFELMLTKQYDVIIGCRSASLASIVEGQRSVSLLYLMGTLTEEDKDRYRDYLFSLNSTIVFPKHWSDVLCIPSTLPGNKTI